MKILVISPVSTHPPDQGNAERVFQIVTALAKAGHELYFFRVQVGGILDVGDEEAMKAFWKDRYICAAEHLSNRSQRIQKPLRHKLVERLAPFVRKRIHFLPSFQEKCFDYLRGPDSWYPRGVEKIAQELNVAWKPDAVLVEYAFLTPLISYFNCRISVVDTHDRLGFRNSLMRKSGLRTWISMRPRHEALALLRADRILALQVQEKAYFEQLVECARPVFTVTTLAHAVKSPAPSGLAPIIGFLGSTNAPNVQGLSWFLQHCWPRILSKVPQAQVHVGGSIGAKILPAKGVTILGSLSIQGKHDFYQNCRIIINPVMHGTGLKIKTVEALQYGKLHIATSHAVTGISDSACGAVIVEDSEGEFANACARMLVNDVDADHAADIVVSSYLRLLQDSEVQLAAAFNA